METLRAFISYARKYEVFARKFALWLSDYGALIWIDVQHIPPGENWSTAIQRGLDECNVLFVLITPEAMASKNVENEWQYFIDQGKLVIPILVEPAKVHFQLARLQYVDFYHQPFDRAFGQLHTELRRRGYYLAPLEKTIAASRIPENQKPLPVSRLQLIKWSRLAFTFAPLLLALVILAIALQLPITEEELSATVQAGVMGTLTATYQLEEVIVHNPLRIPTAILPPTATPRPTRTAVAPTVLSATPIADNILPTEPPPATQVPTLLITRVSSHTPTATTTPTPALSRCVLYASDGALINVRSGPSTGYSIVALVDSGEPCYLLGDTGNGGWIHIELSNGTQGWVYNTLVDTNP